jgi:rhomboid protease GluP
LLKKQTAKHNLNRPSVCRNCGLLIPAGEKTCVECGAFIHATSEPKRSKIFTLKFARNILDRGIPFTFVFVFLNIFIFLLMVLEDQLPVIANMNDPEIQRTRANILVAYGAKFNFRIDNYQEWWRLVTPIFLHIDVIHLLLNMYGLLVIGSYVERLFGSARFVVIWVMSGIAGFAASYFSLQPALAGNILGQFIWISFRAYWSSHSFSH